MSATKRSLSRRALPITRGFSLVELLVVIAIIALVVSIVIPAVGSARRQAKRSDTINLANSLSQACSQFNLDQRRLPGYFTAREMGAAENAARGMSALQNVMLDLAGGIIEGNATGPNIAQNVGPTNASTVNVDVNLIGTPTGSNKAYFAPRARNFKSQDPSGPDANDAGDRASSIPGHKRLPELVDSDGTPLMIWVEDQTATTPITSQTTFSNNFVQKDSSNSARLARYYWNSNAAFLSAVPSGVGKKRKNQVEESLIGENGGGWQNLAAFMGNPASPLPYSSTATAQQIYPTGGRGAFVIHAAGSDGIFFGADDRGGKRLRSTGNQVYYGQNFIPTTEDIILNFDDVVIPGG